MTIKVCTKQKALVPRIIDKGDWIDLSVPETVSLLGPRVTNSNDNNVVEFDNVLIDLEVAIKLPKGFEAVVLPRSSTFKKYGVMLTNSQGVIDNSYCGNEDTWKFGAIAFRNTCIPQGARIAQFRIQLSQKATFFQKLRWLLSSKIKIKRVEYLGDNNRGGIGSTGI